MKQPEYECMFCKRTLEKYEQGVVRACKTCRRIWDLAFCAGLVWSSSMMDENVAEEVSRLSRKAAPFWVDEEE